MLIRSITSYVFHSIYIHTKATNALVEISVLKIYQYVNYMTIEQNICPIEPLALTMKKVSSNVFETVDTTFNEKEAYKQLEYIFLIRTLKEIGDVNIYEPNEKCKIYRIAVKKVHDSLKRIDSFYMEDSTCTSPETDLCRKVFKEIIPPYILTNSQTDFWHRNQSDLIAISPGHSVFKAQIINRLCHRLQHAIANDQTYQKAIKSRLEKSLHHNKVAKREICKIYNQFSKLLVIRIDFAIHRDFKIPLQLLKTYLRLFIKKLHTPNDNVPSIVGFIWKLEYGLKKGYHYHFIFFMDGNIYERHKFYAEQLGKLWIKTTQDKGTFHSCNHNTEKYKKLAIGMVAYNDHEKIENLHTVINYITKPEQFIIEKSQIGQRVFGYSTRKYKKSKAGRPRVSAPSSLQTDFTNAFPSKMNEALLPVN